MTFLDCLRSRGMDGFPTEIPRTSRDLGEWVRFIRRFTLKLGRQKGASRTKLDDNEDLVQDILLAVVNAQVVERFWERYVENDRLLKAEEVAGLLGIKPREFSYRLRKCREMGIPRPSTRTATGQRTMHGDAEHPLYFLQSEVISWQADHYPEDRVTFREDVGISLGDGPTLCQWRTYLARAVCNSIANVYRYKEKHHQEVNITTFLSIHCLHEVMETGSVPYVFINSSSLDDPTPEQVLVTKEVLAKANLYIESPEGGLDFAALSAKLGEREQWRRIERRRQRQREKHFRKQSSVTDVL